MNTGREGEFALGVSLCVSHCLRSWGARWEERTNPFPVFSSWSGWVEPPEKEMELEACIPPQALGLFEGMNHCYFWVCLMYPQHLSHTWLWAGLQRMYVRWMSKWLNVFVIHREGDGWADTDLMRSSLCWSCFQELLEVVWTLRGIYTTISAAEQNFTQFYRSFYRQWFTPVV